MANFAPTAPSPFWARHVHADRRPFLAARTRILASWRQWFAAQDFIEVETAILQVSPGNEAHIGAFRTEFCRPDRSVETYYLHSSPEFACKKLLAAGEERIFSLARVFRNGERGPLHAPEFTMLEWYRAAAPYHRLIDDCWALAACAADAAGTKRFEWRGRTCNPLKKPEILAISDGFIRFADIDLNATLDARGDGDRDTLAAMAVRAGIRVTPDDTWSDVFSKVLSEKIEPHLGIGRMTVLDLYPLCEAALARPARDRRFAERFELYACGVELANAFGELTDPGEQRRRFVQEMAERQRIYGESYPIDDDFLAALAFMPPASGIALGAERLIMLATGAPDIDHVIWTPMPKS